MTAAVPRVDIAARRQVMTLSSASGGRTTANDQVSKLKLTQKLARR